jgi:hypothetical protein
MTLMTQHFLMTPEEAELDAETGWPEVRTGILRILLGHLLAVGSILLLVALVAYAVAQGAPANPTREVTVLEVVSLLGLVAVGLCQLFALAWIIRGQCGCLIYVPERCNAKWLMFTCIMLALVCPAAGFLGGILGANSPRKGHSSPRQSATEIVQDMQNLQDNYPLDSVSTWLQFASPLIALLSNVFFLLFLRAVGRCWENQLCIRSVDLYFYFLGALIGGAVAGPLLDPNLLGDAAYYGVIILGIAIAFLWYLALLFIACNTITFGMARRKPALAA